MQKKTTHEVVFSPRRSIHCDVWRALKSQPASEIILASLVGFGLLQQKWGFSFGISVLLHLKQ
jgi:hypothetical protein